MCDGVPSSPGHGLPYRHGVGRPPATRGRSGRERSDHQVLTHVPMHAWGELPACRHWCRYSPLAASEPPRIFCMLPCMLPCPCCREVEDHEEELAHREDLASAGSTDLTAVLRGETRLTQASRVALVFRLLSCVLGISLSGSTALIQIRSFAARVGASTPCCWRSAAPSHPPRCLSSPTLLLRCAGHSQPGHNNHWRGHHGAAKVR